MNMYFIALLCPEEINARVLKWKLWMKEKFGCEAALRSPAHVTLVPPFWMRPELEDSLCHALFTFSQGRSDFAVQLNDFSHFRPRVIFIDVVQNRELTTLQDELFSFLDDQHLYSIKKDDRPFHPHVTIATRDLHKKAFNEAWEHFKEKRFQAGWISGGVSLLLHNKKNWDVIATSQFK